MQRTVNIPGRINGLSVDRVYLDHGASKIFVKEDWVDMELNYVSIKLELDTGASLPLLSAATYVSSSSAAVPSCCIASHLRSS